MTPRTWWPEDPGPNIPPPPAPEPKVKGPWVYGFAVAFVFYAIAAPLAGWWPW